MVFLGTSVVYDIAEVVDPQPVEEGSGEVNTVSAMCS